MRINKSQLALAVLASSIFCSAPTHAALVNLDSGANNNDNTDPSYPATSGYNFTANNVSFIVTDGTTVGQTSNISIDNNNGMPGSPFTTTTFSLKGGGIIKGSIGVTNPIYDLGLNAFSLASKTIELQGAVVNVSNGINLDDDNANASTLVLNNSSMVLTTTALYPSSTNISILDIKAAQTLNLSAGIGNGPLIFKTIKVGETGNTTINGSIAATTVQFQANNTLSVGNGSIINANVDSINNGTLQLLGTNTVNGTIDNLAAVNVSGGAGKVATFKSDVTASNVSFVAGATATTVIDLLDTVDINGNLDNKTGTANLGTVLFEGASVIDGNVGATKAIGTFQLQGVGKTVEVTGTSAVDSVIFKSTATSASKLLLDKFANLGSIDNQTAGANVGTVVFATGGSVLGTVGATKTIHEIDLTGANGTLTFQGNMNLGTGGLVFKAPANATSNIQFSNNITINGNVDADTAGIGNLLFLDNDILNGTIGATNALNSVQIRGAGSTATLNGDVKAATLSFNGSANSATTVKLTDGTDVTADVTASSANIGNLLFDGASIITGTVGSPNALNGLLLQGAGKTAEIQGITKANKVIFQNTASSTTTLKLDNTATFSTIDNQTASADIGTVVFGAGGQVSGTVGATKTVHEIDLIGAGSTVTFSGNMNLGSGGLFFKSTANAATTAAIANNVTITGNVNADAAGKGNLNLLGGGTVTGTIGAGNALNAVNIDTTLSGNKTATFQNTINASNVNIQGANDIANFQKSVTGNINFTNSATAGTTANFSDGANIIGNVAAVSPGIGTLSFLGASTVSGTVGLAPNNLSTINIQGPNKTVTFNSTVNATNINVKEDGSGAVFNGAVTGALSFSGNASSTSFISVADGSNLGDVLNLTGIQAGQLIFQGGGSVGNVGVFAPLASVTLNTLGGAKTIDFNGQSINTNNINVASAGPTTISFSNALPITVSGSITTVNNGVDIINIKAGAGNTDFKQAIGTPTNQFAQVNMLNANKANTFEGDVNANAINIKAAGIVVNMGDGATLNGPLTTTNLGTLNFLGDSNINFAIAAPGAQLSAMNVIGPFGTTVNLNADIAANNVNILGGGRLFVASDSTVTGNMNVTNGTLSLGPNEILNVTGNMVLNSSTGTLEVNMNNNLTSTGQVIANDASNVGAPGKLSILNPGLSPGVSSALPIVTSTTGAAPSLLTISNPNSFLTTFSEQVIGKTLYLVVTSKSLADVTTQTNTDGVGEALDSIILSGVSLSGSLANIVGQLNSFGDGQSLNYALSTLAPIVDGAIVNESFMAQNNIFDAINDRFDQQHFWKEHHNKHRKSGIASGDLNDTNSGWFRVIRHHANQEERDDIQGYYDDTFGLIAGVDGDVAENIMLGLALSWSNLDMHDKIVPYFKTAANSYQATIYGSFECGTPWFIDGMASFAFNHYDTQRNIRFGDVDLFPRAEYYGRQAGMRALTGYTFDYGTIQAIPIGSLTYGFLGIDGYQETGADTANQVVDSNSYNLLQAALGGKLLNELDLNGDRIFQLEGHAFVLYDFIGDTMELTSQFTGAGPSFVTAGFSPAKFSFNIGGNASLFSTHDWVFTVNYDLHIKENYTANSGMLRVRHEW